MIRFRDECAPVRNGFNVFPLRSGLLGFLFIWDLFGFACYRSNISGRFYFGRFLRV